LLAFSKKEAFVAGALINLQRELGREYENQIEKRCIKTAVSAPSPLKMKTGLFPIKIETIMMLAVDQAIIFTT
jgi:hypothetical protein